MQAVQQVKHGYEASLLQNIGQISSLESALRSLTWILPGRFQNSEIASEGLFSILNIVGLYHDNIIKQAADKLPDHQKPKLSAHGKYTTFWTQKSSVYAICSKALAVIGFSELVIEMIARKKLSRERKWNLIITLEATKAALRLYLFKATFYRPQVQPPYPQREIDPAALESKSPSPSPPHAANSDLAWTGQRTGQTYPTLHSIRPVANGDAHDPLENGYIDDFLRKSRFMPRDTKSPADLILPLQGYMERWNEVIWILRPLIYVMALKKYGSRSYGPFLLSLFIEQLSSRASRATFITESDLEKAERTRRQLQLWKYMLRGPAWAAFTKPRLRSFAEDLEKKTLIGFAGSMLKEYINLFDSFYYYSA